MKLLAIILDTSFLIAYYNTADNKHNNAIKIIEDIKNEKYGYVYTSDYILDEFFTYMQKRHRDPTYCYNLATGWLNLNEGIAEILDVNYNIFYNAVQLFISQKDERKPLSITDCTIVKLGESNQIQYLSSFDTGFDGYFDQIIS